MEAVESPISERAAPVRTSQACQRCRSLKTRCLPSEQPGTCRRCFASKNNCVWADAQRRAKRVRGPSRISKVEQKIDGLVASLATPDANRNTATTPSKTAPVTSSVSLSAPQPSLSERPLAPGSWVPFPSSFSLVEEPADEGSESSSRQDTDPDSGFLERLHSIHNFTDHQDISRPPNSVLSSSYPTEHKINHKIVDDLLSVNEADQLLNEYRSMSESFPFVPLPSNISATYLSIHKPMLFLAILTVASWRDHPRQMTLDKIYRTEFAERTIIKPRRTISLLQSVLVYLSWYHFVFSHKTQQIFSLQQLAIGLALDIGIHQKSKRPVIEVPGRPHPHQPTPEEQRERQRTLLGCYYLSSMIAGGLQKPNLLKHTDYMAECGRDLRNTHEYDSDEIIASLMSLRRLDDQINELFFSESAMELSTSDSRICMNLRLTENQLAEWKRENYSEEHERIFDLSYSFTALQLHSIGLRAPHSSDVPNSIQLNALLSALEAGKLFFDALLTFPASEYHLISFSEWMRLPFVIMTVARLCIPSDAHTSSQWDVKAAQDRVRLDLCLESLCYRMQGLSTYDKAKQPHPDFWYVMRMIMDLTRAWYIRKIRPPKQSVSVTQASASDFSTPDTMFSSTQGHGETSGTHNAGGTIPYSFSIARDNRALESGAPPYDDPFAFLKDIDFDMDQFLDMGIWGDESYRGMGFGGGCNSDES